MKTWLEYLQIMSELIRTHVNGCIRNAKQQDNNAGFRFHKGRFLFPPKNEQQQKQKGLLTKLGSEKVNKTELDSE